jgi:hypothetical protein
LIGDGEGVELAALVGVNAAGRSTQNDVVHLIGSACEGIPVRASALQD